MMVPLCRARNYSYIRLLSATHKGYASNIALQRSSAFFASTFVKWPVFMGKAGSSARGFAAGLAGCVVQVHAG